MLRVSDMEKRMKPQIENVKGHLMRAGYNLTVLRNCAVDPDTKMCLDNALIALSEVNKNLDVIVGN